MQHELNAVRVTPRDLHRVVARVAGGHLAERDAGVGNVGGFLLVGGQSHDGSVVAHGNHFLGVTSE